jgi:hypothetical protein
MAKKKNTRPALVINCESTEDHAKHRWIPEDCVGVWAEGVFWFCRGYNRAEAAAGARETARAVKKAKKNR